MSPIFKNVDVGRDKLSPSMHAFAVNAGFLHRPQRMLVGSMRGERVLLLSELARWYLAHGLEITKVYQLVEYTPRQAFATFGQSVSNARRQGDKHPDLELLASTSKLVGNSAYGKTITNKERHRQVKYYSEGAELSERIRSIKFASMEEIGDDLYELVTHKKKVSIV